MAITRTKVALIFTLLATILFIAGLFSITLLSTRPGPFSQNVYIDENGLLAGTARPIQQDPQMVYQINSLIQSCYSTTPHSPLLQITFAHCLSSIAQSLGFHANVESQSVVSFKYEAPRTPGSEGMLFIANLHPHEFSPSFSGLPILMSSIIHAYRAGYLARDVVIYVPVPTPLQFNPYGGEMRPNAQKGPKIPQNDALSPQTNKYLDNLARSDPLHAYQLWSEQYLGQLTDFVEKSSNYHFFDPSLPLSTIGLNIHPYNPSKEMSLQSIYPKGHQSNLDLASTMLMAMTQARISPDIHKTTLPLSPITKAKFAHSLPLIDTIKSVNNINNLYNDKESGRSDKKSAKVNGEEIFDIIVEKINPFFELLSQSFQSTINTLFPYYKLALTSLQTHINTQMGTEARGYLSYLLAQYNSKESQYLHSTFGASGIDSLTVSSIINNDYDQYQMTLERHIDDLSLASTELRLSALSQNAQMPGMVAHGTQMVLSQQQMMIEMWMRMLSAAHEKLHHSTWLYILGSSRGFSGMSKYAPIFALCWAPLPLLALFAFFSGSNSLSKTEENGKSDEKSDQNDQADKTANATSQQIESQSHSPVSEIPFAIGAIIASFFLGLAPSIITIVLKTIFLTFISTSNTSNTPFQTRFTNFPYEISPNILMVFNLAQIMSVLFVVIIYFSLLWKITKKLKTSGWFITISATAAPLSLMNFAFSLVLLAFTIPNLLLNFSPVVWVKDNDASTTKPTPPIHKLLKLIMNLFSLCVLLILSPLGWYLVDKWATWASTSSLTPSHLLSPFMSTFQLGWSTIPQSFIKPTQHYFPASNSGLDAVGSVNDIFGVIQFIMNLKFNGLNIQQLAYWLVFVPTFTLSLCAVLQRIFGCRGKE